MKADTKRKAEKIKACDVLYHTVVRYVKANGGTALVIGGIQIQQWPGQGEFNYLVAVTVTGRRPIFEGGK